MQGYVASLLDQVIKTMPELLMALIIVAVSFYVARIFSRFLLRMLDRQHAPPGVSHLLAQTLKWVIIGVGVIAALQRFFDVATFLTGLGIIGFTIGFALQNIMQNFVSGVILLVQQPFRVGDDVHTSGYDGTILKIDLRTTEMKTFDGLIVFLPNANVLSQPIVNYTRARRRRVEVIVGVAYSANPEKVRGIVLDAIRAVSGRVDEPAAQVLFQNFSITSMELTVHFWVDTKIASTRAAKNDAMTRIKNAFEKKKIVIPHNQFK